MLTRWTEAVVTGGDRGRTTQHSFDRRWPHGPASEALSPAIEFGPRDLVKAPGGGKVLPCTRGARAVRHASASGDQRQSGRALHSVSFRAAQNRSCPLFGPPCELAGHWGTSYVQLCRNAL